MEKFNNYLLKQIFEWVDTRDLIVFQTINKQFLILCKDDELCKSVLKKIAPSITLNSWKNPETHVFIDYTWYEMLCIQEISYMAVNCKNKLSLYYLIYQHALIMRCFYKPKKYVFLQPNNSKPKFIYYRIGNKLYENKQLTIGYRDFVYTNISSNHYSGTFAGVLYNELRESAEYFKDCMYADKRFPTYKSNNIITKNYKFEFWKYSHALRGEYLTKQGGKYSIIKPLMINQIITKYLDNNIIPTKTIIMKKDQTEYDALSPL